MENLQKEPPAFGPAAVYCEFYCSVAALLAAASWHGIVVVVGFLTGSNLGSVDLQAPRLRLRRRPRKWEKGEGT